MQYKLERWQSEVLISLGKRRADIEQTLLEPIGTAVQETVKSFAAQAGLPEDVKFMAHQDGLDVYLVAVPQPPAEEQAGE